MSTSKKSIREVKYCVEGMHCASCELLVEQEALKIPGVVSADAACSSGTVNISYQKKKPSLGALNRVLEKHGYRVLESLPARRFARFSPKQYLKPLIIASFVVAIFFFLNSSGFSGLVNVTDKSSLPTFFLFGLVAGFSTCAALIGGLVLSLSKRWSGNIFPHLAFNVARLLSFTLAGAALGALGSALKISPTAVAAITILVALVMIVLGLQMLGVSRLARVSLRMPQVVSRKIVAQKNRRSFFAPALLGALTVLLPCGFTITTQGLSLSSGNALQGSLMMLAFALGTLPALLIIGFSAASFSNRLHLAGMFQKTAGILVIFFGLYNLNSQLNVLGAASLSDFVQSKEVSDRQLSDGQQVIKMQAKGYSYQPSNFVVQVGIPVRWEIEDLGTTGCTNAIVARGLFDGQVELVPGETSVKEFVPQKTGTYKFSCWMGMVSGSIKVVAQDIGASANTEDVEIDNTVSGVSSCGVSSCGGCGTSACGCGR